MPWKSSAGLNTVGGWAAVLPKESVAYRAEFTERVAQPVVRCWNQKGHGYLLKGGHPSFTV